MRRIAPIVVVAMLTCVFAPPARAGDDRGAAADGAGVDAGGAQAIPLSLRPFTRERDHAGAAVVHLDRATWDLTAVGADAVTVERFPIPGGGEISLELERYQVTGPGTRFVVVGESGEESAVEFDPSTVSMFRGRVVGYPASRVYLSLAPGSSVGRIDLGPGEARYLLSHQGGDAVPLRESELAVFTALPGGGLSLPVPLCGAAPAALGAAPERRPLPDTEPITPRGLGPIRGLRHLQLIVDTDHEFYQLFGDATAAATYIVQLYGVVSDIYIRDVNTRLEITYVRLWETPNDPYNLNDLLSRMGGQWHAGILPEIPRDAVQLLSGRRNISPAGQAFISALCNPGLSWAAYVLGYFVDPQTPRWTNRDIYLAAHELGHNCGSNHTDVYGLDNCGTGAPPAQRGSIMSYCGQGYSGSDANYDLWFHEVTANAMRQHIFNRSCIATDCNANNIPDALDISSGTSPDANANGVPDECEDCNGNGVLDPAEIAAGSAADLNNNLIPDTCEADCNSNGIPDTYEVFLDPAIDLNANRIPDSCEGDCDGDGVADYNEIQADMSLDVDRNVVLDSCQRCTPDGPTDLVALDHAWNIYAGSRAGAGLWEFFAGTGVLMDRHGLDEVPDTQDLVITTDRRVLVSVAGLGSVVEFDADGQFVGTFIAAGTGGLADPAGMLLTPGGTLLVASRGGSAVLEFDAATGAFLRTLVQTGSGGLVQPFGLAFGPGGNLFVTSSNNQILEFDAAAGSFVRTLVTSAASGGLSDPRGLVFKPDGNLLVCSFATDDIKHYDGATGAFLGRWNINGVPGTLMLDEPWCIRLGPDGDIYISRAHAHRSGGPQDLHVSDVRIFHFDIETGEFVRALVMGDDTTLNGPTGFDFMPGDATDCNMNQLPDSCDLSSGASRDINLNTRPDECDCLADWNSDGSPNSNDISAFLTAWLAGLQSGPPVGDVDGDGAITSNDISAFLTAWLAALAGGC